MSNLIDYLEEVKYLPFDQEPLNILDKVCINEIGYLTYEKWLSASDLKETINLHDYAEGKDLNPDYSFMVTKERVDLAEAMVRSRRFAGLNLSDYCSVLDKEVEKLEEVLPIIWEELSPEARAVIEKQGVVYTDQEGDLVTSIVNNKDCVFTCYDEKGCCYCAIEKAYRERKTDFYKPVSCHLYPIRIGDYGPYKAVNYNRWDVCKAAVLLGKKENLPVYQFLKEPLIRKFGEEWYKELVTVAEELKRQQYI